MPDSYELHLRQIKRAKMEEQKTKPSDQSVVHTPGPWECEHMHTAICKQSQTLARVYHGEGRTHAENVANANLIAAAPDLLAALREIRGELCRRHSPFVVETDYAYINDAINKATGRVV
jgi:hypothetical protein